LIAANAVLDRRGFATTTIVSSAAAAMELADCVTLIAGEAFHRRANVATSAIPTIMIVPQL
jgi:hypothetical protein